VNKKLKLLFFIFLLIFSVYYTLLGIYIYANKDNLFEFDFEKPQFNKNVLSETSQKTKHLVIQVFDGDTIQIDYFGQKETVRILGIDAPESIFKKECFGKEAKGYLKNLIDDKYIYIEFDKTQSERDKFDRLLAYIYLENELINEKMIKDGYAFEYTYNLPYNYMGEFKEAEKFARENDLGLWGEGCKE